MGIRRTTEQTASISTSVVSVSINEDADFIEIYNKGANTAYFRTDGTAPTAGAAGNADEVRTGVSGMRVVPVPGITTVKFICDTAESAELVIREIYTDE